MPKGKVRTMKTDKGYGFILDEDRVEYFFHRSECNNWHSMVEAFEENLDIYVTFIIVDSEKGPRAHDVRMVQE